MRKPVLVIGGTTSGVGKTSVAVGLMAALRDRGLIVQAFKVGPGNDVLYCFTFADFIDPMHHESATGRPSINLDGWMLTREQVCSAFERHMADADIAILEGVMGLFDGRDGATEAGSTAQIAKWLGAPVALVIDCSAVARSAAAIIKGYQDFDPELHLGALIFNKVGGPAHTQWLKDAVAAAGLGLAVLGGIPRDESVAVEERYLGLHLPRDSTMPPNLIHNLATLIRNHVDLDEILALGRKASLDDNAGVGGVGQAKDAGVERSDTANVDEASLHPGKYSVMHDSQVAAEKGRKKRRKKSKPVRNTTTLPPLALDKDDGLVQPDDSPETSARSEGQNDKSIAVLMGEGGAGGARASPPQAEAASQEEGGKSAFRKGPRTVRIAVARDVAFCFYYHDNLALLQLAGAELVIFSPLCDPLPPNIAGVYLGGGYPERHAVELAENKLLRAGLKAFADAGGIIYAECGGLMFLTQSIQPRGEPPQPMVGVFPFKTILPAGKYTMGYVEIEATAACPLFSQGTVARGHVHHASELVEEHHVGGVDADGAGIVGAAWRTGYVARPQIPGAHDTPEGFTRGNVLASYVHLHFGGCPDLASSLVEACRSLDVQAVDAAVAASEAVAALLEGACILHGTPPESSLGATPRTRPGSSAAGAQPLPVVRSSPELNRYPNAQARSRSVDLAGLYAPAYANGQHYSLAGKAGSPATTLNKVVSSGSLSCYSAIQGYGPPPSLAAHSLIYNNMLPHHHPAPGHHELYAHPHLTAWHAATQDHVSIPSESPLQLSPRTANGSDTSGVQHHSHYRYGSHYAGGQELPPGHIPLMPSHGGDPLPPPPHAGSMDLDDVQARSIAQWHHHHHHAAVQYAPHAPPHHPYLHVRQPSGGLVGNPAPPLMAGPVSLPSEATPVQRALAKPQLHHGGIPLDLTPLGAEGLRETPGLLTPYPSGSATPHNWQYGYPPSDKVVTLGPGATEIAWALGLGNRVVAVSDTCDYPADVASRAKAARHVTALGSNLRGNLLLQQASTAAPSASSSASQSPVKPGDGSNSNGGTNSRGIDTFTGGSSSNLAALGLTTARGRPGGPPLADSHLWIDEQVLARERPGLVVYEEDEPDVVELKNGEGSENSLQLHRRRANQEAVGRRVCDSVVSVGLQTACRVVALRRSTLADVLSGMITVGEAAGVAEEANRAVDRLRARLRRVACESARAFANAVATNQQTSSDPSRPASRERPLVLVLRSLRPVVAEGLWASDLVTLAGADPGPRQPGDPPRELSWEEVVVLAPDVLVIAGMHDGTAPSALHDLCTVATYPGWWLIPAVKTGAVYLCEEALIRRGGPRLVEGAEALARMVHGDDVSVCCPPRAVMKLSLRPGQRCRPRLLPNYFMAYC